LKSVKKQPGKAITKESMPNGKRVTEKNRKVERHVHYEDEDDRVSKMQSDSNSSTCSDATEDEAAVKKAIKKERMLPVKKEKAPMLTKTPLKPSARTPAKSAKRPALQMNGMPGDVMEPTMLWSGFAGSQPVQAQTQPYPEAYNHHNVSKPNLALHHQSLGHNVYPQTFQHPTQAQMQALSPELANAISQLQQQHAGGSAFQTVISTGGGAHPSLIPARIRVANIPVVTMRPAIVIEATGQDGAQGYGGDGRKGAGAATDGMQYKSFFPGMQGFSGMGGMEGFPFGGSEAAQFQVGTVNAGRTKGASTIRKTGGAGVKPNGSRVIARGK
ncbi:hypothetical protein HK101_002712, partial [Irineochytrium annulatum]